MAHQITVRGTFTTQIATRIQNVDQNWTVAELTNRIETQVREQLIGEIARFRARDLEIEWEVVK